MASKLDWQAKAREYDGSHHRGGGKLEIPRTPAQKILVEIKRQRLKREAMRRLGVS